MTLKTHKIILNVVVSAIVATMLLSALAVLLILTLASTGHLPPSGFQTTILIAVAGSVGVAVALAGRYGFTRYCDWIRREFELEEGSLSL